MRCINQFSNLGFSPCHYLVSSRKEKNIAAGLCKTTLAVVLLVPGILVVLGCLLANVFLSPCLKTKSISQQSPEQDSSTTPVTSRNVSEEDVKEASPSLSNALSSPRRSISSAVVEKNSSGKSSKSSEMENEPSSSHVDSKEQSKEEDFSDWEMIEIDERTKSYDKHQEEKFRALSKKLQPELSELRKSGNRLIFLEGEGRYKALPEKILWLLGTPCSRQLDAALSRPIGEHITNRKINKEDWKYFQVICEDTVKFLNAYEKMFDIYRFDPATQAQIQSWHEKLCLHTIDIWLHARNIVQLLEQTEMEKLAAQILARFEALSAKNIPVSAEASSVDQ